MESSERKSTEEIIRDLRHAGIKVELEWVALVPDDFHNNYSHGYQTVTPMDIHSAYQKIINRGKILRQIDPFDGTR